MKTVCKKLFSLMLVAILLVSAVPFAASADETPVTKVIVNATIDGVAQTPAEYPVADTAEANELYAAVKEDPAGCLEEDFNIPANATAVVGAATVDGATMTFNVTFTSPASAPAKTTYTVKVGVFNSSADYVIGTVGSVDLTEDEVKALSKASAASLLAGTAYAADAAVDNVYSVFPQGTTITVYLKSVTTSGGTTTNPPVDTNTEKVIITVNTGSGEYTKEAYKNQLYSALNLAPPARNGQDFLGWKSATHGAITATTVITGNDTVTAMWSAPIKYTLILDENRGATETVNTGKQVVFGQPIGALPTPERDGYVFAGWKLNGTIITKDTIWDLPGDGTAYAQWKLESDTEGEAMGGTTATADGKVYLEIYTNGDTATLAKRVDITDLAKDNKITQAEVESVVKKYITAKSGYTLKYEGLFDEETWWWYTRDPETDGEKSIIVNRDGDDYVYVMVKNVKVVASDPTNPKTGDGIFAVMSVMMGSGAALVSLNELRKRKMI